MYISQLAAPAQKKKEQESQIINLLFHILTTSLKTKQNLTPFYMFVF